MATDKSTSPVLDTTPATMVQPEPEKPALPVQEDEDLDDGDYITGFKLWAILISGTLVQFVMMLDQSIIATVRIWNPDVSQ